jgi:hypothetical protein
MRTPQIVIALVAAIALAGGGFALGMTYERSQAASGTAPNLVTAGRGPAGRVVGATGATGAFAAQVPITGRVLALNEGSITVATVERSQAQQAAGASPATTSQIVLVGASTRIVKTVETEVRLSEIKVSDQVTIVGTTDSAGVVSASSILVGPTNWLGVLFGSQTGTPGGFGQRPGASPTARP